MKILKVLLLALLLVSRTEAGKVDAVVKIKSRTADNTRETIGSGTLVTKDGLVITANHVVASEQATVLYQGKEYKAHSIHRPYGNRPSVISLRIDGTFENILGVSESDPKRGQQVWFIGYPGGGPRRSLRSTVTATAEDNGLHSDNMWLTGVAAVAKSGYSGGPLIDDKWNILGVCYASSDPEDRGPPRPEEEMAQINYVKSPNVPFNAVFFHTKYVQKITEGKSITYEAPKTQQVSRPELTIFHSYTCAPCQRLIKEWNTDREFREWLKTRFQVRFVNTEMLVNNVAVPNPNVAPLMKQYGVTAVPFTTMGGQNFFAGYTTDGNFKKDCEELLRFYQPVTPNSGNVAPPPPENLPPVQEPTPIEDAPLPDKKKPDVQIEITIPDKDEPVPSTPIKEKGDPERWTTVPPKETEDKNEVKTKDAYKGPHVQGDGDSPKDSEQPPSSPSPTVPEPTNGGSRGDEPEGFLSKYGPTIAMGVGGALLGGLPWYVPLGLRVARKVLNPNGRSHGEEVIQSTPVGKPSGSSTADTINPYRSLLETERSQWSQERSGLNATIEGLTTQVSELKNREQTVQYNVVERDGGLARMRQAMKRVSEHYPRKAGTVKMIEDTYSLITSGEAKDA